MGLVDWIWRRDRQDWILIAVTLGLAVLDICAVACRVCGGACHP